jgi:hypothetical protein
MEHTVLQCAPKLRAFPSHGREVTAPITVLGAAASLITVLETTIRVFNENTNIPYLINIILYKYRYSFVGSYPKTITSKESWTFNICDSAESAL